MSKREEQQRVFTQRIAEAVAVYQDNALPAVVAVEGATQAILDVLDGDDTYPGYVIFPKIDADEVTLGVIRRVDETGEDADQDINLAGNLTVLFKEINS